MVVNTMKSYNEMNTAWKGCPACTTPVNGWKKRVCCLEAYATLIKKRKINSLCTQKSSDIYIYICTYIYIYICIQKDHQWISTETLHRRPGNHYFLFQKTCRWFSSIRRRRHLHASPSILKGFGSQASQPISATNLRVWQIRCTLLDKRGLIRGGKPQYLGHEKDSEDMLER